MSVALGVLVSGSGTILEAFLAAGLVPRVVASDRACRGLEVARAAGVEALLVDRTDFGGFGVGFERERYSAELATALAERGVGLVAMAGFGTVLAPAFFAAYPGRVLNTHPSLLPAFKGWHAVAATLAARVAETGCTVHLATEDLDDGPILAQRRVAVLGGDDEASLHERIKAVERALYPEVVTRALSLLEAGGEPADLAAAREPA